VVLSLFCIGLALRGIFGHESQGILGLGSHAIAMVLIVACQAVFLLTAGTVNLCKPIRGWRLCFPLVCAAFMMTMLVAGLWLAVGELLRWHKADWFVRAFWVAVAWNWVFWLVMFAIFISKSSRYDAVRRLTTSIICGSLLELLVSIPAHLIVSRRGGCFAGMHTGLGIIAGILVLLWAFGPGIILLFLRDAYVKESRKRFIGAVRRNVRNSG